MRPLYAVGLGLMLTLAQAGTSLAQEGMTAAPRAGETVLNCADGGWDVAGGTCRGRGGVVGSQVVGSGVASTQSTFQMQPNAIFPGGASGSPAPVRCGWAHPCETGE